MPGRLTQSQRRFVVLRGNERKQMTLDQAESEIRRNAAVAAIRLCVE